MMTMASACIIAWVLLMFNDVYIHHIQYRFEAILNNEIKQVGNHRWHCTAPGLQQRRANCQPCHVGRAVSPVGTAWHSRSLFAWSVQFGNSSSLAIQLNIFDLGLDELIRISQFVCVTVANTEVSSRRSILLKAQYFKLWLLSVAVGATSWPVKFLTMSIRAQPSSQIACAQM